MDPMEKIDPESHEWGHAGRKFVAQKLWAPTAAGPFLAAHLQSLNEFPPSQGADTLSMKKRWIWQWQKSQSTSENTRLLIVCMFSHGRTK
jgi:hypothetical protein